MESRKKQSMTVIPYSLPLNPLTLSSRGDSARDLVSKIRFTLKNEDPLIAGQNSSKCHVASCKAVRSRP